MMNTESDLLEAAALLKATFQAAGWGIQLDNIESTARAGEYELAYVFLCEDIYEFELDVSTEAYALLVKVWAGLGREVQSYEGKDWRPEKYLGSREGFSFEYKGQEKTDEKRKTVEEPADSRNSSGSTPNDEFSGAPKPGVIEYHPKWIISPKTAEAFRRLVELGTVIYSVADGKDFTFMLPEQIPQEQFHEAERLFDEIAREVNSEAQYIDWYPHGWKYRIYLHV